jgi:hypothetical protein
VYVLLVDIHELLLGFNKKPAIEIAGDLRLLAI